MTVRHLLIACISLVALGGCADASRGPARDTSHTPISAPELHDSLPDAGVPHTSVPDASAPSSPLGDAGPTEEIDNTIYWDAATKPTADNVRGIDAGVPDR